MLKIEEGTPLSKSELRFLCADEEKVSDLYLLSCEELEKRGFEQYEISNFAKNGKRSFHNTRYWLDDEYIGIGPSAHSFMEGRRFYFDRSIKNFLEKPFLENETPTFFSESPIRFAGQLSRVSMGTSAGMAGFTPCPAASAKA